jgi:serine phosphatase RsbU (regulator of sigma subunit)
MSRLVTRLREAADFVREYAAGVRSRDVERMFRRDAAQAYEVLTRTQPRVDPEARGLRPLLRRLRVFFLGLSYTLSPPRRLLFALALVLAAFDACQIRIGTGGHRVTGVSTDVSLALVSVAALVFLLALELVDRVRVRDELEVARDLQRQLLPTAGPDLPGYRFAHSYRTANEIGGDYYGFLHLPDGRLVLAAADASGHGMAAGLLMVIAHTSLRLTSELDPRPEAAVAVLNRALCDTGGPRAFLTLFYGVLEPASGRLDYVCAGHPFPLLRRAGGAIEELGTGSLPLGLRRELEIRPRTTTVEAGDLLVLYSDGLPEGVVTATGDTFGFDRLRGQVAPGGAARTVHDRVMAAFDAFMGGETQQDDLSLVVIERAPTGPPPPPPPRG